MPVHIGLMFLVDIELRPNIINIYLNGITNLLKLYPTLH